MELMYIIIVVKYFLNFIYHLSTFHILSSSPSFFFVIIYFYTSVIGRLSTFRSLGIFSLFSSILLVIFLHFNLSFRFECLILSASFAAFIIYVQIPYCYFLFAFLVLFLLITAFLLLRTAHFLSCLPY